MKLPEAFERQTETLLKNEYPAFVKALNEESPVSIRINTAKQKTKFDELSNIPWCDTGFYLKTRPSFTFDPLFHAGCYYVQEASSMFLEQAIKTYILEPVCCLDLCAAPGGKSTHLSAILPFGSLLVSNEVIRSRAHILTENIIKWGGTSTIITNNDPAEIGKLRPIFDVVIADVPCSGEGMFRKDPSAIEEWSSRNVSLCAERQRRIIADVWPTLKQGGILIYSTCTYNTQENEKNIQWITEELGGKALPIPADSDWNILGSLVEDIPVSRLMPHRTRGEGLFIAVVRKEIPSQNQNNREARSDRKTHDYRDKKIKIPQQLESWLINSQEYSFTFENGIYSAIPEQHQETYYSLKQTLKVTHAGISLGELKGKDFIPAHSLAMSIALHPDAFNRIDLDLQTALKYLKKEALFNLPDDCSKGYLLVTYENQPLGFIKNIGNRANNLYPQEWRIRKTI